MLWGDVEWEVELPVRGGQIAAFPHEKLLYQGHIVAERAVGGEMIESAEQRFPLRSGLIPSLVVHAMLNQYAHDPESNLSIPNAYDHLPPGTPDSIRESVSKAVFLGAVLNTSLSYRTYHYEINHLLRFGSRNSAELHLAYNGENVFPLLRNWRDRPDLEERYEFVLATMREIFPHLGRVGFEQAGQTVTMTVSDRRWPDGKSIPIARESTGFITALLHLCAIASTECVVTFDEIETSLHPRAIRVLIEAMRRRAASHDLRIVLATQSETVLDQFRDDPSRVFVLEPKQERSPQALTELFSPEYLSQFSLGDLFAHLEFGADDPPDP